MKSNYKRSNSPAISQTLLARLGPQGTAFCIMLAVAVLTGPLLLAVTILLFPIIWLLAWFIGPVLAQLYPFFAIGKEVFPTGSRQLIYAFSRPEALALTLVQWSIIAAIFSHFAKRLSKRSMLVAAMLTFFFVGIFTSVILAISGLQIVVDAPKM